MDATSLLRRAARFLDNLAGSQIPVRLYDEYEALLLDLTEYLSPDEPDHDEAEGISGEDA